MYLLYIQHALINFRPINDNKSLCGGVLLFLFGLSVIITSYKLGIEIDLSIITVLAKRAFPEYLPRSRRHQGQGQGQGEGVPPRDF